MKTTTISLLLICLSSLTNFLIAQDRILLVSGEEIDAKVIEIAPDLIKYKRFSNLEGPAYSIERKQVFLIWYENGEKDIFENAENLNDTGKRSMRTQFLTSTDSRDWSNFEQLDKLSRISLTAKIRPWKSLEAVTIEQLIPKGNFSLIYYGTFDNFCPYCKYFLDAFSTSNQVILNENNINIIFIARNDTKRAIRRIPTNIDKYNWTVDLDKVYVDDDEQFFAQKNTTSYPNIFFVDESGNILFEISSWRLNENLELLENKIVEELSLR